MPRYLRDLSRLRWLKRSAGLRLSFVLELAEFVVDVNALRP